MRVGPASKKDVAWVWALYIGLAAVFSAYVPARAYAEDVSTPFEGDLEDKLTFIRPKMPGDVAFNPSHPDHGIKHILFSLTWYYHGDASPPKWTAGTYEREDLTDPTDDTYKRNYFVRKFIPSASGDYDITVVETDLPDNDTTLFLYKGGFDPAWPLANLYVANDDIDTLNDDYRSSMIDVPLEEGTAYYLVMTSYDVDITGHVKFEVVGPGAVTVVDPNNDPTEIIAHPTDTFANAGGSATFQVTATGRIPLTYQWQVDGGGGFSDISNGGKYSGATTSTLTISNITADMDGYLYRVIVSGLDSKMSTSAKLRINQPPVFVGSGTELIVSKDGGAKDVTGLLHVSDPDPGQTLTWTEIVGPSHGTLTIMDATASSGSEDIAPGGTVTYQPASGYSGPDSFQIEVSDGYAAATRTINVTVVAKPAVTSVAVPADGIYGAGKWLDFKVEFDQEVKVDGTPRLELTIGSKTVYADYVSGTGTTGLLFRYTVAEGDLDEDGIEVGILDGGSITNLDGTENADLTLNLGVTSGVKVDAVAPSVTGVTSPKDDGAYSVGTVIPIDVTFSEPVIVTGMPQLTLETGDTDRTADVKSVNGATVTFEYTVQAGDTSADLDYASAGALALNGGAIKDQAGNAAVLTLPHPGAAGSLGANKAIVIDTTAPKAESVDVPAAGTYKAGDALTFAVNTDEPVAVDTAGGTPRIKLTIGSADKFAEYTPAGSTDTKLNFVYTVAPGDEADGIQLASAMEMNGGTIRDAAGNGLELALGSVDASGIKVDTSAPQVTGVSVPPNGTYAAGQELEFVIAMNEPVTVTGVPMLNLTIGEASRSAIYIESVSDKELKFRYTVASGDLDDKDGIEVSSLSVPGGAGIADAAGNAAELTLNNVGNTAGVLVDGVAPTVTGVSVPADGTYTLGQTLSFTVQFSEDVVVQTVGGTPVLPLEVGTASVKAAYVSGTGTKEIVFEYVVKSGDEDTDGIELGNAIELSGGTMTDLAGNGILPALHSVGDTKDVLVDAGADSVEAVAALSAPEAGASNTVTLTVKDAQGNTMTAFSGERDVTVTGHEEAPDQSYGSIDGKPLTGAPVTVAVVFTGGKATVDLKLNKADAQTITFAVAGVKSTDTVDIAPVAGPAASMKLTADIASPAANGGTFANQPVVTLVDAFGNVRVHDDSTVVTAVKHDPGSWSLTGTTSRQAQAGVVTFTDLGAANAAAVAGAQIAFKAAGLPTVLSSAVPLPWPSLSAPVIETVTPGDGHVRIGWSPVYGSVKYAVYMRTDSTDYGAAIADVTDTVYEATGLTNGTTYFFTVKAVNPDGTSPASNEVSATPQVPAAGTPVLQSAEAGNAQVALTWSPVIGATGFKVYVSEVSGAYGTETDTVTGSVYGYTVTGLTNGKMYYFAVKAVNSGVESAFSNEMSATPHTVPSAPTNVRAGAGDGQAIVTFTPPADNGGSPITGYEVTVSPGGQVVTGSGSPIIITGLTNGTSYTFTVKAINKAGAGEASAPSNAVIPQDSVDPGDEEPGGGDSPAPSWPVPVNPTTGNTGVNVLVNGKAENLGAMETGMRNGQTVTIVTLDETRLEQRLAEEGRGAVVTIPVSTGTDIVVGELNGRMVKAMEAGEAVLEIRTDRASYMLPAKQINIDAVSGQIGAEVVLQDIKVQIGIAEPTGETVRIAENAAADGSFTLIVPPIEFTVRAIHGDKVTEVAKFNAYVERTIALPDDVDPDRITTGVVVEPDGTVRHVPTRIIVIDGKYYAQINSLTNSAYTVVWHPLAFRDMAGHWAEEAVNDMGSRMVIEGVGGERFAPDLPITRAEFAAIIVRGLGLAPEDGTVPFSDIKSGDWYAGFVRTAHEYGLLEGYDDGTFRPMERITREQAMVIIARAMAITGLAANLSTADEEQTLASFADAADVSKWARSGMAAAVKAGIVSGRDGGRIAPGESISRAEVAVLVRRLLQNSDLI